MSQADRDKLAACKELARLASPYAEEIVKCAVAIMRDVESRQRLNAATFLAQLMQEGEPEGGKGEVRVVVLQANDVQRLGEMQREARATGFTLPQAPPKTEEKAHDFEPQVYGGKCRVCGWHNTTPWRSCR